MARIRTVKPEFFVSESLAEVSIYAERTFGGLITQVDDDGRYKDNAAILHGAIWALRPDHTAVDVEQDLIALAAAGLICRYVVAGKRYLHLVTFKTHQKISHATPSKLPACPVCDGEQSPQTPDSGVSPAPSGPSPSDSGVSPEDFGAAPIGSGSGSGSGKEGEGNNPAPRKRGTRTAKPPAAEPDPEVVARNALAREIVKWWWDQLGTKPAGKNAFHASARVVDGLLAVGHEPKAVASAARDIGTPLTTARMEIQLGRNGRASPQRRATVEERMDQADQALAELKADRAAGIPAFGITAANPNAPALDFGHLFREIES